MTTDLDRPPPAARPTGDRPAPDAPRGVVATWFSDGWTVTWRNLLKLRRNPEVMVFAVLQPIMFVVLFSQVYGGSIRIDGGDYTDYLMAGIFGQTVLFGSTFSGYLMAQDLKEGLIDRFRTLPMHSSAVLVGRTNADLVLNTVSMVIMIGAGAVVGWRFSDGVPRFLAGVGLLLLFSYAFSWVMALLGIMVRTPEVINNAAFMVLFPLTFISNAFVQSSNLPGPLEVFANWNPVSALVQAARELFGNTGSAPVPDTFPMQHPVLTVVAGSAVMLAVFVPLAVARFRRSSSR
ncbi:ABC transporter permease [Ornithinimicrobium pekingense]|uniref:Transport permease protein n=1 Tax=Ornithinimicrobium pekingense TaxID=384677 RepID=A0ABQ2FB18_9MICO|nr:ABC transporter permease [Ornithinimicrobium pekingense]GGK70164.1 transport permease protein [Ornithinimicrobium pekingense]